MSGDELWFDVRGKGPPIVLMHSALSDARSWDGLVDRMHANYQMVRFDARGFGKSPAASGPFDMVTDLLEVMRRAGLDQANVVGNSMGADVAIAAAISRPSAVTSLTLIGPGIDLPHPPENSARLMERWRSGRANGDVESALEAARALWLSSEEQVQRARETVADHRSYEAMTLATLPEFELADMARISVPVLVMVGDGDDQAILDSAELLAAGAPNSKLVQIKNARHHPQEDKPVEVAKVLHEFVADAESWKTSR